MLQQIMPEQIPAFWEPIKETLRKALPAVPGESENKFNNILTKLLEGVMTCWVAYKVVDGEKVSNAIVLTIPIIDVLSETKSLLVYALATINEESGSFQDYQEGILALKKYAKSTNCNRIVAYVDDEYLINMIRRIGGITNYSFVSFSL